MYHITLIMASTLHFFFPAILFVIFGSVIDMFKIQIHQNINELSLFSYFLSGVTCQDSVRWNNWEEDGLQSISEEFHAFHTNLKKDKKKYY